MNEQTILQITLITAVCLTLNIPFGMLRSKTKTLSVAWFFCIHACLPISAILRQTAGLSWWYIPLFIFFSVVGQQLGIVLLNEFNKGRVK